MPGQDTAKRLPRIANVDIVAGFFPKEFAVALESARKHGATVNDDSRSVVARSGNHSTRHVFVFRERRRKWYSPLDVSVDIVVDLPPGN